jgi:uncharacterized protein YuzE
MKLHYYAESDSLYIDLIDAPAEDSQEVRPGVVLDFDADRRLVGVDIDNASKNAALDSLQVEELPLRQTVPD